MLRWWEDHGAKVCAGIVTALAAVLASPLGPAVRLVLGARGSDVVEAVLAAFGFAHVSIYGAKPHPSTPPADPPEGASGGAPRTPPALPSMPPGGAHRSYLRALARSRRLPRAHPPVYH